MLKRFKKNLEISETLSVLEESDKVVVTTDKTNSFRSMDKKNT